MAQTVAPPVAEYRGKASGMFELRNDGDVPLAAILEVHGFTVDEKGTLVYQALDPALKVEIGQNSFVIPPHESHYVFYKASSSSPQSWFSVLSTMTRTANQPGQMRINFVLPHVVYMYQKQKLKKEDISVRVTPAKTEGEYTLEIENHSVKLGRVESVTGEGFEKNVEMGGFPIFPEKKRQVVLHGGTPSAKAKVKVSFEDGFSVQVPLS
ncbi:MAG TPA: hypothetical protein VMU28_06080 [Terriglobales bacterium]|nr:hypothetical protein [Terriglobales bacterium]